MIIMCLRFVIFWILVNGLITPFGSPVSRGIETLPVNNVRIIYRTNLISFSIVSCVSLAFP